MVYPGANHGFDAPDQPIRSRTLPDGHMVTTGTDPAARDAARERVMAYLSAHGRAAP